MKAVRPRRPQSVAHGAQVATPFAAGKATRKLISATARALLAIRNDGGARRRRRRRPNAPAQRSAFLNRVSPMNPVARL